MTENRLARMGSSASLTIQQRRIIPTEYPTRIRDMNLSRMHAAADVKPFIFSDSKLLHPHTIYTGVSFYPLVARYVPGPAFSDTPIFLEERDQLLAALGAGDAAHDRTLDLLVILIGNGLDEANVLGDRCLQHVLELASQNVGL